VMTPQKAALLIFIVSLLTILGAFIFEYNGYPPCPLCLMQRWAYYAAMPLALVVALLAQRNAGPVGLLLALIGLIFAANSIFGIYHSGIEWGFWPGPDTCSGGDVTRGLPKIGNEPVISCSEAAIRIFGLSLAGWNAVICAGLAAVAFHAARSVPSRNIYGSSSVSQ
ncbi:MAG: disulfide bond formation protein B, partial [Parvibaculaceae bacterium]